ncbi:MAG: mechanosensitive ion channel family protein [Eubacteriales bacterium]|nr:mechanosensitive ion channel family protein [Eubacteriales bacterium]MDD4390362.1 mechanosensitive ion channel family protein [Eubacteriales bacterium]
MDKIIQKISEFMPNILGVALITIIGILAIKIIIKITVKALKRTQLDESVHVFIINMMKIIFWIILFVLILGYLKIPTAPFVAVLGAAGAAVALALKDSLGNIAGGILILVNKPFVKGDFVDIGGTSGLVHQIDMLITTLKTKDNKVVSVPNGTVSTSVITNYTREENRRVDCEFRISYTSSIGKAKDTILAVVEANPIILKEPEPYIAISSQDEKAVYVSCFVWCKSDDYWDVKFFLEENVKIAFDEAQISVPYPQIDVHIKK